jgi:outer membrane protein assembly factor BamA
MHAARLLITVPLCFACAFAAAQVTDSATVRFRVIGVVIDGNKVTQERVILRELTIHEGDTLTSDDLYARMERSRQNLLNTSLFNTVGPAPILCEQR